MKRVVIGAWIVLFVMIVALVLIGCLSRPPKIEAGKIPPLPSEIAMLSEQFGEPKIAEAYAIVLIWEIDGERYHILCVYDPFIGEWLTQYYKYSGVSSPRAVY